MVKDNFIPYQQDHYFRDGQCDMSIIFFLNVVITVIFCVSLVGISFVLYTNNYGGSVEYCLC